MKKMFKKISVGILIFSMIVLQSPYAFAEESVAPTTETSTASSEVSSESSAIVSENSSPTDSSNESDTPTETETETTPETSTPLVFSATTTDPVVSEPLDISASTTNNATTTSIVNVDASTGGNTAIDATASSTATSTDSTSSPQATSTNQKTGTTTIETGDALANADVINVVNVNVFNSQALIAFLSQLSQGNGNVDLGAFLEGSNTTNSCIGCYLSTTTIPDSSLNATTTNDASINNAVVVRSGTGDNTASSTNAEIDTGNAYANANIVNVVNTNLVNSNYVVLTFNNFGSLSGDIVLPNASFFNQFLTVAPEQSNSTPALTSSTTNSANITNDVTTDAQTGDNIATSTDGSTIDTGNSHSGTTVLNNINENHVGSHSVAIVFRVYGNWSGNIYNLPSGFNFHGTPVSLQFVNGSQPTISGTGNGSTNLDTTNNASINNNVLVSAATGNNNASGNLNSIKTGNAYAAANIVNMANTTIVGSNWMRLIINIFGDWNGNVSFGQPNLWVGTRLSFVHGGADPGNNATFTYTVKNNGNAPAHDVHLNHSFDPGYLSFKDNGGNWNMGTINPGETKTISYVAKIGSSQSLPYGLPTVQNTISVTQTETDGDPTDNTDTMSFVIHNMPHVSVSDITKEDPKAPADFKVTKTYVGPSTVSASSTVDYTVKIKNEGGRANQAVLIDRLVNDAGQEVTRQEWNLGAVLPREEITVTYTAFFNASSSGMYTNFAQIISDSSIVSNSLVASTTITIIGNPIQAPLVKIERIPQNVLRQAVLGTSLVAVPTNTSTTSDKEATTTDAVLMSNPTEEIIEKNNQLAGAFAAFGDLPWYWYALLTATGAIYITNKTKGFGYFA